MKRKSKQIVACVLALCISTGGEFGYALLYGHHPKWLKSQPN